MCEGQRGSEAVTAQGQGQKDEEGAGVAFGGEGTSWRHSFPPFCVLPAVGHVPSPLQTSCSAADGDPGYLPSPHCWAGREEVGYRGGFGSGTCWDLVEVHRRLVAELIVFPEWAGGKAKGWASV